MKLTTTELKRLIQEEYQKLNTEADDKKKSSAEARIIMMDMRDAITSAGVTDLERDIILDFMEIAINFSTQRDMNSSAILEPLNLAVARMRELVLEPEEKS